MKPRFILEAKKKKKTRERSSESGCCLEQETVWVDQISEGSEVEARNRTATRGPIDDAGGAAVKGG